MCTPHLYVRFINFDDAWLHNSEHGQPSTVAATDTSAGSPHAIRNALVSYF